MLPPAIPPPITVPEYQSQEPAALYTLHPPELQPLETLGIHAPASMQPVHGPVERHLLGPPALDRPPAVNALQAPALFGPSTISTRGTRQYVVVPRGQPPPPPFWPTHHSQLPDISSSIQNNSLYPAPIPVFDNAESHLLGDSHPTIFPHDAPLPHSLMFHGSTFPTNSPAPQLAVLHQDPIGVENNLDEIKAPEPKSDSEDDEEEIVDGTAASN